MPLPARIGLFTVIAALALASFTWPSGNLAPRDLPVGVAGSVPAFADADAFDVHRYATAAQARQAVRDRDVYGAVAGDTLYVATGASPAVASVLREAVPGASVVDLAPGTSADPRAATLGSLALPLTLLGIVSAVLAILTARSPRERLALLAGAATVAGLVGALFAQTWLDALPGSWLALAGGIALAVAAIGATVTGLASHLGKAGIAVGAVLMMLVGNSWSGITTAPELLPEAAGTIGQLLPTGAAGNLLRSVAFFDGAAAGQYVVVLAAWLAGGLALIATAAARRRRHGIRVAAPAAA